ncbi:MAG: DUF6318 family protein [Angustibacter sp.]
MITRGHLWRFVLGGSAVVALAACQSSDRAGPPSTVTPTEVTASTSPTASASATPTESDEATAWARVPAPARAHTYAGAQAFAEFYIAQVNASWKQARPELLDGYADAGCKTCANFVATAVDLNASRQRYEGDAFSIRSGTWLPESTSDLALVDLVITQRPTRILNEAGEPTKSTTADGAVSRARVQWVAGAWRIESMQIVAPR